MVAHPRTVLDHIRGLRDNLFAFVKPVGRDGPRAVGGSWFDEHQSCARIRHSKHGPPIASAKERGRCNAQDVPGLPHDDRDVDAVVVPEARGRCVCEIEHDVYALLLEAERRYFRERGGVDATHACAKRLRPTPALHRCRCAWAHFRSIAREQIGVDLQLADVTYLDERRSCGD
jgi:hypothetical protein